MILKAVTVHSSNNKEIIFSISLEHAQVAYMTCKRTNYLNEERAIVILDTLKFLELWKADPNPITPELSNGTRDIWIKDSKYPDAKSGFQEGIKNPVPLARIAYHELENTPKYIDFTNGITRTIWLLSQGAIAFPVECHVLEAEKLSFSAGIKPGEYFILSFNT